MTRSFALMAALGLGACQLTNYDNNGVFVAYLPDAAAVLPCDTTITENLIDASPPDAPDVPDSPWVFEDEATVSDEVVFVQIFESRDGNVVFQIDDDTYFGTRDGDVITVEWDNTEDSTESATNDTIGYRYTEVANASLSNVIELTRDKETKGYAGNWKRTLTSSVAVEESDEWDGTDPYSTFTTGQINTFVFTWLVGGASNDYDTVDCEGDPCAMSIAQSCEAELDFELVETNLGPEAFPGVRDAGQPSGI